MAADRGTARVWFAATVATLLVLLAGCSGDVDLDTESADPSPSGSATAEEPRPVSDAQEPGAAYTLIPSEDPAELAVAVSQTYLSRAQVAILAPLDDWASVARASSIGAAVGAPVLLTGEQTGSLDTELLRLGVVGVVTVGAADLSAIDTTSLVVAPAPEDAAGVGQLFGVDLTEVEMPAKPASAVNTLIKLGEGEIYAPAAGDAASDEASTDDGETSAPAPEPVGELPALAPPNQLQGASMLLSDGDPEQIAAIATALGAGADAARAPGDVRGNPRVISLLSETRPATVVGLGTGMGNEKQFTWRTETAATGVQLPGDGQLVFDGKRYVALYGSPVTPSLGLLGEQGVSATIERADRTAHRYDKLTDDTVVPALEIIVTVASGSAGDDGNYSNEWPAETFVPLIEAAEKAGQYVVLDFQSGRTDFLTQIKDYESLLRYPHVGVALDPEWRLKSDEMPLQQIGSVGIGEVNDVVDWVADYVRENHLPQKLIVLHQFQTRMIRDREDLDTSRTEVALLIHADGQGSQGAKQATWRTLHEDAPDGIYWGWKNFVDEDSPMLTPEQTYSEVDPLPDFVSYQ